MKLLHMNTVTETLTKNLILNEIYVNESKNEKYY